MGDCPLRSGGAAAELPSGQSLSALAGSQLTQEILTGSHGLVWWSRVLPGPEIAAAFTVPGVSHPRSVLQGLQVIALMGTSIYDAGVSITVDGGQLRVLMAANTFAGEPMEARIAYARAQTYVMDHKRWLMALADVEKRYGGSLLARQAAELRKGSPIVGPAGALAALWLQWVRNRATVDRSPPPT